MRALLLLLFACDETRRIEIVWKDMKKRRNPEFIRIPAFASAFP